MIRLNLDCCILSRNAGKPEFCSRVCAGWYTGRVSHRTKGASGSGSKVGDRDIDLRRSKCTSGSSNVREMGPHGVAVRRKYPRSGSRIRVLAARGDVRSTGF
jgi:hypothetical protein